MKRLFRQTLVIARRDFIATVATPTFLLFLLAPFFMIGFGLVGGIGASQIADDTKTPQALVAIVPAETGAQLLAAERALRPIYREPERPPPLRIVAPAAAPQDQARALLAGSPDGAHVSAVLFGSLAAPHILHGPSGTRTAAWLAALAEQVVRDTRSGLAPGVPLTRPVMVTVGDTGASATARSRHGLGFAAMFAMFLLTLMLAGQAVGMMAEEKGNKVIEILAAAVPLEAVFLGKLIGMFGVALLFIGFWVSLGLIALTGAPPEMAALRNATAAIGLPLFLTLLAAYFTLAYLLLGAVFLGVGAQAATVREIQMLSLPITLFQVGMFGIASAAAPNPDTMLARFAEIFPFSSPFAMAARAAVDDRIWPHLLAIGWQIFWVAIVIVIAAQLFRRGVLKSGPGLFFGRARRAPD